MNQLIKYFLCVLFGVAIGFLPYYFGTREAINRPTVNNEFGKIKTRKGETTIDVSSQVEDKNGKRRLFNRR